MPQGLSGEGGQKLNHFSVSSVSLWFHFLFLFFVVTASAQSPGWTDAAPVPTPRTEITAAEVDGLIYVTGGNGLAPSTLLDANLCGGDLRQFAFLVVDRNGYIAGDMADPVALTQFRTLLDEVRLNGQSMSSTPLGCRGGRVGQIELTD